MKRTHIKVRLKNGETKGWSGPMVRREEDQHYLLIQTGAGLAGFPHTEVLEWELRTMNDDDTVDA